MSHHLVVADAATYIYPDGTRALEGVSFRLTHGESVAVVGGNGAGKSSLLLLLGGCRLPTSGTIQIGDSILTAANRASLRSHVGMVFQDADDQLFMPTVGEDVAFGPEHQRLSPQEIGERVREALLEVGASDLAERPAHRLSAGQKRRVAIATVLSMRPDLLVMDEPSSSLDPYSRRRLIELLKRFSHTRIIATHDLELALDVCQRTLVLVSGRLVADGPTRELLADEALMASSRLEVPVRLHPCPTCDTRRERAPAPPLSSESP